MAVKLLKLPPWYKAGDRTRPSSASSGKCVFAVELKESLHELYIMACLNDSWPTSPAIGLKLR